jgi:hypothetical protein
VHEVCGVSLPIPNPLVPTTGSNSFRANEVWALAHSPSDSPSKLRVVTGCVTSDTMMTEVVWHKGIPNKTAASTVLHDSRTIRRT